MKLREKNILLLLERGTLGGAERQALGLAKYLSEEKKCSVDLLFTSSNKMTSEFEVFLAQSGIRNTLFFGEPYLVLRREITGRNLKRLKWSIQYLLKLRKSLIENKYEVLIPFLNMPSKIAYYLYKLLPTVKFTFWHQLGLDVWKFDLAEAIAVKNTPAIIGNAENCFHEFIEKYNLNRNKLHLLPQQLTLQKKVLNQNQIKARLNIPENVIVFGMVSHFRTFKYHELTLQVFRKFNGNYPNTHLILMGNVQNDLQAAEIYKNLYKIIKNKNLSKTITLLSNENLHEILSVLDVGILLSLIEGTPNIVMEYMLYGLPIIASNHPGCKALLNESQFLVENNSKSQIYDAMEKLYLSKKLRGIEGSRNTDIIKGYDIKCYVEKLENILTNAK